MKKTRAMAAVREIFAVTPEEACPPAQVPEKKERKKREKKTVSSAKPVTVLAECKDPVAEPAAEPATELVFADCKEPDEFEVATQVVSFLVDSFSDATATTAIVDGVEEKREDVPKAETEEEESSGGPPTKLARLNHHPRDDKIHFQEEGHIYTVNGEVGTYKSATTYIHEHFTPFNSAQVIQRIVNSRKMSDPTYKYYGKTKEEILYMWSQTSVDGTALHYDIECYMNDAPRINTSIEYQYFLDFVRDYPHLKPYRTEWCVWHEDVRISGSIDMVFENPDGTLQIYDWKRTGDLGKGVRTPTSINPCIGHVPDSKYWHYALQLNLYRRILQEKYGKVVTNLVLVRIHPDNVPKTYERVEVPFMDAEIEALFEYRRHQLQASPSEAGDYHPWTSYQKRKQEKEDLENRDILFRHFGFTKVAKKEPVVATDVGNIGTKEDVVLSGAEEKEA